MQVNETANHRRSGAAGGYTNALGTAETRSRVPLDFVAKHGTMEAVNNMQDPKMSTISVNLPDAVMSEVAERAQKNGFSDVGEFVSQMIAKISDRQKQVEVLAIEGINSGPSEPWNGAELEAIKESLRSKHGS